METSPRRERNRSAVTRAARVAVVVGSALTLINHADAVLAETSTRGLWWKIPLTYCVPFLVSLYSSHAASRAFKDDVRNS